MMVLIKKSDGEWLTAAISKALEQEIKKAVETEAAAAAQRVETRVREMTGQICGRVLERWSMERFGQELVIRVNFENLHPNPNQ